MRLLATAVLLLAASAAEAEELFRPEVAAIGEFPRVVPRGRKLTIQGKLQGRYREPELILIAPRGKTYLNPDNTISGKNFIFTVKFTEGKGPYRLEIIARNQNRIISAARVHVFYGMRRPSGFKEPPLPEGPRIARHVHERVAEKRFLRMINEFRKEIGIKPVRWNEAVATRAREHARVMAKAGQLSHRFGGLGIVEHLRVTGPLGEGWSGPTDPWDRVDSERPFDRPSPAPPGPRTENHVVPMVQRDTSLEVLFEKVFVREPAFRICMADPNCLEVSVGAHWQIPKVLKPTMYFSVCFVQINDKTLIKRQEKAFEAVLRGALEKDLRLLRHLGVWGRLEPAMPILTGALSDERPEVSSAAFDALLLLDEERMRETVSQMEKESADLLKRGQYARSVADWKRYAKVEFDEMVPRRLSKLKRTAEIASIDEMKETRKLPDKDMRRRKLEDLLERCGDLRSAKRVQRELKKLDKKS